MYAVRLVIHQYDLVFFDEKGVYNALNSDHFIRRESGIDPVGGDAHDKRLFPV